MSQATVKKKVQRSDVILPQEHFWKCYSPQFELPLSSVCSVALHGLVIGILLVVVVWRNLPSNIEALEPPRITVVEIAGGGGTDGFGGPGVGPGVPGELNQFAKVQDRKIDFKTKPELDPLKIEAPDKLKIADPSLQPQTDPDEPEDVFGPILREAEKQVAEAMRVPVENVKSAGVAGGSPGTGGGKGTGIGPKIGPGSGDGRKARQGRWIINFSGDGQQHFKKLKALKVTLAIPTQVQGWFQIVDLSGPAVKYQHTLDLSKHTNKLMWKNEDRQAIAQLSQTLKLKTIPPLIVIFLPENVEQEMAELEARYGKGVSEHLIEYTFFEIIQRPDGSYGPVVVGQK